MKTSELNKIVESYQQALTKAKEELKRTWYQAIRMAAEELNDGKSSREVVEFLNDSWDIKDVMQWESEFKYALDAKVGKEFGSPFSCGYMLADEEYTGMVNYYPMGRGSIVHKVSRKFLARVIELADSDKMI